MKVEIENRYLEHAIKLLDEITLLKKRSRHRTKFVKLLRKGVEEYLEDFQGLLKEHCHLDEEGEPKVIEKNGGQYWDVKDPVTFSEDKQDLDSEVYVIDGGNNEKILETVKKVLRDSEIGYQGEQAEVYDYLCDQFGIDE